MIANSLRIGSENSGGGVPCIQSAPGGPHLSVSAETAFIWDLWGDTFFCGLSCARHKAQSIATRIRVTECFFTTTSFENQSSRVGSSQISGSPLAMGHRFSRIRRIFTAQSIPLNPSHQ